MATKRPGQKIPLLSVDELLGVPASEDSMKIAVLLVLIMWVQMIVIVFRQEHWLICL